MHVIDLNRWIADLGTAIARAAAPEPKTPGTQYREGVAMLSFTVYSDGGIADIRIVGSSGDEALDRRAVAKLRRADPLPTGPEGIEPRTHIMVMRVAERIMPPARREMPAKPRTFATA